MKQDHILHLYWRAGFGALPKLVQSSKRFGVDEVVDNMFRSSKPTTPLKIDTSEFDVLDPKELIRNPQKIKTFAKKSRDAIQELNYAWIDRMIHPKEVLRERMTLFWANHFVCKDNHILHVQQYNNTLRRHALGNFRDFLKAVSKEAAMIKYLNNKQNKKFSPNENFARELMELFTLGVGHYSEQDIKESARAFTGYNNTFKGEFQFRKGHHDFGVKTVFGKTGNFSGDDIIDMILEQRQCATFICKKLYGYFVNPKVNDTHVEEMTSVFCKDFDIEQLMRFVFTSKWFYDEKNIGIKIKSPIDLLVGLARIVPVAFERKRDVLKIQKLLGQTLLDPPNVAGWKGHTSWIDVNTIMIRLKLASVLLNNAIISLKEKGDFNNSFKQHYFKHNKTKLPFKTVPDWNAFFKTFETVSTSDLEAYMINGVLNKGTKGYLDKLDTKSKQDYCIQLMSLPEYQMC